MSRNILITGGTGALGTAVVEKFLKNGDTVLVTDIREASDNFLNSFSDYKTKLKTYKVNVVNEQELKDFSTQVKESFGGINILVNIVGGFSMSKIAETNETELDKMLSMNLKSAFFTSKTFISQITEKENGRIINIAARAGLHGVGGMGPYCISKAGVISLTETLSEELKETSTTVNAILPSTIDTEPNRKSMPGADFSRWVSPMDIANVIFFLASKEARAISGASIPVYYKA